MRGWLGDRVGTFGLSYAAHTQAALSCLDPPGLAAQFLDCGGFSNAYRRKDPAFAGSVSLDETREPDVTPSRLALAAFL